MMSVTLLSLAISPLCAITGRPKSAANDVEILNFMTSNTALDHIVLTGIVVGQQTKARDKSGSIWPYVILEIEAEEVLLGKSFKNIRVVVPASFYVENQEFNRCAFIRDGTGPGVKEMEDPMVFFERDRILISADYLARSVYDVDSTGAAWVGNVVRFLKAGSDSLYREVVTFDEDRAQAIAGNGYGVNPIDFVTREFKPTGATSGDIRMALKEQAPAPKK